MLRRYVFSDFSEKYYVWCDTYNRTTRDPHGTHTRPALATQVAVSILICYEVTRESEIIAELSRLISVHRD